MKISKKNIIFVFIIILFFTIIFSGKSYAVGQMFADADAFLGYGNNVEDVIKTERLKETSDFIYKAFLSVAIVVALIVGIVIGIKYIYESAEGQAKLKEAFIPYVVGCLIVFSAFPIWKMVINFGNEQGFMKETLSKEEMQGSYQKVLHAFLNQGKDSNSISSFEDNQIKAAWQYVLQVKYPEYNTYKILYEYRNSCEGYLCVEYLSRFADVDREWTNFYKQYYTHGAGDISAWVDGIGGAVELLYSLSQSN